MPLKLYLETTTFFNVQRVSALTINHRQTQIETCNKLMFTYNTLLLNRLRSKT
jgi:hypothetical protein